MILVDPATGVVRAQRLVTLPERFTDVVRTSVDRLLATPFPRQAHDAGINALYNRYPRYGEDGSRPGGCHCTGGTQEAAAGGGVDSNPGIPQPPADGATWQAEIIAESVAGVVAGRAYGQSLPDGLAPWYCYVVDSGHSIAIIPQALHALDSTLADRLVPVPVQAVIAAGWTMSEG